MDKDSVERPGDILTAADALLKAVPNPPPTEQAPAAGNESANRREQALRDSGEPAGDAAPQDAPASEEAPAPEGEAPASEEDRAIADPMAERARELEERERQFEERHAQAEQRFKTILENPEEYKRARKELGLERTEEPAAAPVRPVGPDPIANPDGWRYRRQLLYQRHAETTGQAWTPGMIQEAVERDLSEAKDAVHAERLQKLEEKIAARERAEQEWQMTARERQQAEQLTKQLEPHLARAFPKGVPADAREDIDAHVALARARGKQPDLAAIVAKVSGQPRQAVTRYVQDKKKLAVGAGASRSSGGQAPAPTSIIDRLPATLDSITEMGDMLAKGQLKR